MKSSLSDYLLSGHSAIGFGEDLKVQFGDAADAADAEHDVNHVQLLSFTFEALRVSDGDSFSADMGDEATAAKQPDPVILDEPLV